MRQKSMHRILFTLLVLVWPTLSAESAPWAPREACATAVSAPLNDAVRMNGLAGTRSDLFALEIPSPGILGVEVTASGTERTEPILLFLGSTCPTIDHILPARHAGNPFTYLNHSADSHIVEIRTPGVYFLRVIAADPLRTLDHYKLSSRFLTKSQQWSEALSKDDDIDIDEWDEDILSDNLISPPAASALLTLPELCGQGREADLGTHIWCPTPLIPGELIEGELSSPWGDDRHHFTFELERPRVFRIEASGSVEIFLTLYDPTGNRLAISEREDEGRTSGILKVLPSGQYRLRVEGLFGSQGPYRLIIHPELGLVE